MFYDMIKSIVLDVLGIRVVPIAPDHSSVVHPEEDDHKKGAYMPPPHKDYSYGEDRMGGFPVDRERVL